MFFLKDMWFDQTQLEAIRNTVDLKATQILASHGVSPEQYISWVVNGLEKKATLIRGGIVAVILLIVVVLVVISIRRFAPASSSALQIIAPMLIVVVGILSFVGYVNNGTRAENFLSQGVLALNVARQTDINALQKISEQDWGKIRNIKVQTMNKINEKNNALGEARARNLKPYQTAAGILSLVFLLLAGSISKSQYTKWFVMGCLLFAGLWLILKGARFIFAERMTDYEVGTQFFGRYPKLVGSTSVIFGILVALFGVLGLFF